ncbi:hypothetical protein [Mesorhizobium sp.]|uniref:hypothetical protein n=1 Tax=Mesorhizobium sp. TaxID=1871066 RepID=UPI00257F0CF6|nr:hypothetical protein [Mesorhizobium sp.]
MPMKAMASPATMPRPDRLGQRNEHFLAEIARADHDADDDHCQRHQDRLVDAKPFKSSVQRY